MRWEDGETLTTKTWADDATLEGNPYGLAKVEAERVVRNWHAASDPETRPHMVTIHPSVVFGPPMSKIHLRGSLAFVMALVRREIPVVLPMQVNIVDVRDVAEAHVRALTQGEDAGRYLTVSGDMQFKDISLALRQAHPELKTPTFTLPYPVALVVSIFHKRLSLAWARQHLRRRLYWDATPAERDLGMAWRAPQDALLDSMPVILENDWA